MDDAEEIRRLTAERDRLIHETVLQWIANRGMEDTEDNRRQIEAEVIAECMWRCALNDPRQI